ncbi:MAG: universal stress protein [Planctomycetota bacterium]|jgi:nucleotide-binding universal stress UspA family protein|nr:universal stress protein [Blastopirellula sp.]
MLKFTGNCLLVPWDFSDMALAALKTSMAMVSDCSKVKVVHVGLIPTATEPTVIWDTVTEQTIQEYAAQNFRKTVAEHPELAGLELITLFGDPGFAITDYAQEVAADLIVISSHGRRGLSRLFMGSVAERVVRLAQVPVLVLRGPADAGDKK